MSKFLVRVSLLYARQSMPINSHVRLRPLVTGQSVGQSRIRLTISNQHILSVRIERLGVVRDFDLFLSIQCLFFLPLIAESFPLLPVCQLSF